MDVEAVGYSLLKHCGKIRILLLERLSQRRNQDLPRKRSQGARSFKEPEVVETRGWNM